MKSLKKFKAVLLAAMIFLLAIPAAGVFAADASKWEYVVLEDGSISVTGYFGSGANVTIPSEIDGKKVFSIGDGAFKLNGSLKSVKLEEGIVSIGDSAFLGCKKLESVEFPDSLKYIGDMAFSGCGTKRVDVPKSIKSIGDKAFGFDENGKLQNSFYIACFKNSAAEKYAINNGLDYLFLEDGQVIAPNGVSFSEISVTLVGDGSEYTTTVADGFVSLKGIPDGEYTAEFSAPCCATRTYTFSVKDEQSALGITVQLNHLGDVNGDESVDIKDMSKVYKNINRTASLEGYAKAVANVNNDESVDIKDYSKIYKHINKTALLW